MARRSLLFIGISGTVVALDRAEPTERSAEKPAQGNGPRLISIATSDGQQTLLAVNRGGETKRSPNRP